LIPTVVDQPDSPEILERFNSTLDLVDVVARQVARAIGSAVEVGELVSFGQEGLLNAARRYDPKRGVPFRAYANYRVRGAVVDGVRSMARLPRRAHRRLAGLEAAMRVSEGAAEDAFAPQPPGADPRRAEQALIEHLAGMATAMAIGLVATPVRGDEGESVGLAPDEGPEQALARAELLQVVRDAIEELPHEEAELIRRHYLEGERFDAVARELGLSKSWASRLHTRAIARLCKRLRGVAS
jgi:RNA polymerase sigma factor for flagellar operon FliA